MNNVPKVEYLILLIHWLASLTRDIDYVILSLSETVLKHDFHGQRCMDCISIISSCAPMEEIRLNASALSDPHSLGITLSSTLLPNSPLISTLVHSRSAHCFVDSKFVQKNNLSLTSIPLTGLSLPLFL